MAKGNANINATEKGKVVSKPSNKKRSYVTTKENNSTTVMEDIQTIDEKPLQQKLHEIRAKLPISSLRGKSLKTKHRHIKIEKNSEAIGTIGNDNTLEITEFISLSELANLMDISFFEVISKCMSLGITVSINQRLDAEEIELVASEFGFDVKFIWTEEADGLDNDIPEKQADSKQHIKAKRSFMEAEVKLNETFPGYREVYNKNNINSINKALILDLANKPENYLTPFEKMNIIANGISKKGLEQLKSKTTLDYDKFAKMLSTTKATLINKKGDEKFSTSLSERILSVADVYSYGYEVFEDTDRFNSWMLNINRALGGKAPYEIMDNQFGREEVRNIIGRIAYGVFS